MLPHYLKLKYLFATAVLVLAGLVCVAAAFGEMRIFELQHRPAGELAEMVRSLVSADAKVATHRNTLVVNSSPAELDEVAKLVASYDQAASMMRITVEQGRSDDARERDLHASGRLNSGSTSVRVGRPGEAWGNSVYLSTGDGQVRVGAQDRTTFENRSASQFLTVMDGSPAMISIGQRVPFTSELYAYCLRHPHFVATVEYQNVDTGFEVLPRRVGEQVQLEIRPFMAFLHQDNPNRIVFSDLATTVRVPVGSWFDLAGHMASQNGLSREIIALGMQNGQAGSHTRIRVDLLN